MGPAPKAAPVSMGSPRFRSVEHGAFLVTDALFPVGHRIENHFHDRTVVGLTLRGKWESVLGSTRLANSPGMLHVEPAGESHANIFGSEASHVLVIQPNPSHGDLLHPFRSLLDSAAQVQIGLAGMRIAERLRQEVTDPDDLSPLAIEGLAVDLMVSGTRFKKACTGPASRWLERVVEALHERFLERPSLPELSSLAGVCAEHLNREFRRVYGLGTAEYLRRLRLEWAAERLRGHHLSLAEIAVAAGFADQSHFTRRFRQQFGVTPAAFRAAWQKTQAPTRQR